MEMSVLPVCIAFVEGSSVLASSQYRNKPVSDLCISASRLNDCHGLNSEVFLYC